MKNKIIAAAILLTGFATNANSQAMTSATTSAVLVTPISISKTTDMHFGTFGTNGLAGTVILDYANSRTKTGGVSLIAGNTQATTAVFTVTGSNDAITIAVPAGDITLVNGTSSMTAGNFVCEQGTQSTIAGGTLVLKVKAILNVPVTPLLTGTYTNAADLIVTVNYQ